MRYYFILLLILFTACQSGIRYRAIRKQRSDGMHRQVQQGGDLRSEIDNWLGVSYKYGGTDKSGVDCSGFTSAIYLQLYGIQLLRTARDQYINGRKIRNSQRSEGDLVFFRGERGAGIDHVGIYLGDDQFVHSSTQRGVIISSLEEEYYKKRYIGACRYIF